MYFRAIILYSESFKCYLPAVLRRVSKDVQEFQGPVHWRGRFVQE